MEAKTIKTGELPHYDPGPFLARASAAVLLLKKWCAVQPCSHLHRESYCVQELQAACCCNRAALSKNAAPATLRRAEHDAPASSGFSARGERISLIFRAGGMRSSWRARIKRYFAVLLFLRVASNEVRCSQVDKRYTIGKRSQTPKCCRKSIILSQINPNRGSSF